MLSWFCVLDTIYLSILHRLVHCMLIIQTPRVRLQFSDTHHNSDILHNLSVATVSRVGLLSHALHSTMSLLEERLAQLE